MESLKDTFRSLVIKQDRRERQRIADQRAKLNEQNEGEKSDDPNAPHVGMKIQWNSRNWEVVKIQGGRVSLKSEGLPTQTIDWLKLAQWLDQGKAKRLKEGYIKTFLISIPAVDRSIATKVLKQMGIIPEWGVGKGATYSLELPTSHKADILKAFQKAGVRTGKAESTDRSLGGYLSEMKKMSRDERS